MESLFFHPKVVHLPMALGVLMPVVAIGLLVAWWRAWLPARAFVVVVALQAALVVSGVAALRTGEAEEDRVEAVVPERALEAHEDAAQLFVAAGAGVLALFVGALALSKRKAALPIALAGAVGTIVVLGLGVRTGQVGGALVYRHGAARAYGAGGPAGDGAPVGEAPADRGERRGDRGGRRVDEDDD